MSSNREEPFSRILESIISPSHVDHGFVLRTDLIGLLSFWLLIFNYSCSLRFSETREYSIIDGRIVYLSLSLYLICSIQIKSHLFHLYKTHLQKIEFVFFFRKEISKEIYLTLTQKNSWGTQPYLKYSWVDQFSDDAQWKFIGRRYLCLNESFSSWPSALRGAMAEKSRLICAPKAQQRSHVF